MVILRKAHVSAPGYRKETLRNSTSEAQKIAIARALYKDAPFVLLDEPTASLDPLAEAEIYDRFRLFPRHTALMPQHSGQWYTETA